MKLSAFHIYENDKLKRVIYNHPLSGIELLWSYTGSIFVEVDFYYMMWNMALTVPEYYGIEIKKLFCAICREPFILKEKGDLCPSCLRLAKKAGWIAREGEE